VIGWDAHAVSHQGVGPAREPEDLCIRSRWRRRGTDSFLGQVACQGRQEFSMEISANALNLMGDWCGPAV